MARRLVWTACVGALILTAAVPASAQTAGGTLLQSNTGPIVDGAWTITLSGCVMLPAGGSASACNGTDEVIPVVAGSSLSLVFEAANGGAIEAAAAGQISDLTFSTITVSNAASTIDASFVNLAGTGDAAAPTLLTVNEGTLNASTTGAQTNLGNSPVLQSVAFASVATATATSVDIKTDAINASSALTLNSATIGFTAAPEPVSASILAVGMAGLGMVRRKRRQKI